jgi:hypothetical protein
VEDYVVYVTNLNTGVENPDNFPAFELQPNPAKDWIQVLFTNQYRPAQWMLRGLDNRVFVPLQLIPTGGADFRIPIDHLPPGMYCIELRDEKGRAEQRRFVKW